MNEAHARKYTEPPANNYRSWKQNDTKKDGTPNHASMTDFPDLVKTEAKKTVFEGTSLASKLREVIAAEEEAAIAKRLKKGETPESILRESCVILPLKNSTSKKYSSEIVVPDWVTDETKPIVFPPFRPKSLEQISQERRYRRLGVNPRETLLYDEPEQYEEEDSVSIPSMEDADEDIEEVEQENPMLE